MHIYYYQIDIFIPWYVLCRGYILFQQTTYISEYSMLPKLAPYFSAPAEAVSLPSVIDDSPDAFLQSLRISDRSHCWFCHNYCCLSEGFMWGWSLPRNMIFGWFICVVADNCFIYEEFLYPINCKNIAVKAMILSGKYQYNQQSWLFDWDAYNGRWKSCGN